MSRNRKRPGRIRSKRTNGRQPLLLSDISPMDFNVRKGETKTILCPDCRTWRKLTGEKTVKISEHGHEGLGKRHARCPGSNQVVEIDIDVRKWQARQDRMLREAMPPENRRTPRQFHKPLPPPATPVHRLTPPPLTLEAAHEAYAAHRNVCAACTGRAVCRDGQRLALTYTRLLQQGAQPRPNRRHPAQGQQRAERRQGVRLPDRRTAEWSQVLPAVERTDDQRHRHQQAVTSYRGPQVPTEPVRITA